MTSKIQKKKSQQSQHYYGDSYNGLTEQGEKAFMAKSIWAEKAVPHHLLPPLSLPPTVMYDRNTHLEANDVTLSAVPLAETQLPIYQSIHQTSERIKTVYQQSVQRISILHFSTGPKSECASSATLVAKDTMTWQSLFAIGTVYFNKSIRHFNTSSELIWKTLFCLTCRYKPASLAN